MKTTLKRLAVVPLAWPAFGGAHALAGGVPHSHDASAWAGFVAATAVGWAAYRGAQWLSARRGGLPAGKR